MKKETEDEFLCSALPQGEKSIVRLVFEPGVSDVAVRNALGTVLSVEISPPDLGSQLYLTTPMQIAAYVAGQHALLAQIRNQIGRILSVPQSGTDCLSSPLPDDRFGDVG